MAAHAQLARRAERTVQGTKGAPEARGEQGDASPPGLALRRLLH